MSAVPAAPVALACSTCGRPVADPRVVRLALGEYRDIVEGCVDVAHEPHAADVGPGYERWVARARATGITGVC